MVATAHQWHSQLTFLFLALGTVAVLWASRNGCNRSPVALSVDFPFFSAGDCGCPVSESQWLEQLRVDSKLIFIFSAGDCGCPVSESEWLQQLRVDSKFIFIF